jgi:glycolate dehydrogenase FAD-binding subunit
LPTFRGFEPMTAVVAQNEDEVAAAVREARRTRNPFEIVAAGSKRALGRARPTSHDALDVSALRGIVAYEPEELIVTVRPGTPVSEITTILAGKGQRLGFDPPDVGPLLGAPAGIGTIGGAISCDISGPARVRHGAVRDQLLGFRGVNGMGEVFKAGGKVVKNVTGFDIPKLVCGAFGTLCVLTEVTLRVFPKPPRSQTLAARDLSTADAFALLRKVWASPLEASGLCCTPAGAFVRLEGEAEPLADKVRMLQSLSGCGTLTSCDALEIDNIANGKAFLSSREDVWRVAVPPSQATAVIEAVGALDWTGDCAGGLLWMATNDHERLGRVVQAARGYATLVRATATTRGSEDVFEKEDPVRAQLTRAVKAAFDPLALFNPGRMWDGV